MFYDHEKWKIEDCEEILDIPSTTGNMIERHHKKKIEGSIERLDYHVVAVDKEKAREMSERSDARCWVNGLANVPSPHMTSIWHSCS